MTLCIAAVALKEMQIVTISDQMLSTETMSIESESLKFGVREGPNRWISLFAGDPTIAQSVVRCAHKALTGTLTTTDEEASSYQNGFKEELKKKIEDTVLSPYGWSLEKFLRDGLKSFGENIFAQILNQINNVELETDFVVAGFDEKGVPEIFSITDPGIREFHRMLGFHAIGCGATLANASLMSNFNGDAPIEHIIYRLAEAKFRAEKAPGVGKNTVVTIHGKQGEIKVISPEDVEQVRSLWNSKGNPPVPTEAKSIIKPLMAKYWIGERTAPEVKS
jgi:hypothetical protein